MQRLFLLVAVMLLSGCLTAPPKEAARPTLMPRAQSYKDLTHLPAPTGKIFVSVYNIQDETGQFKPYPASNFSTAVPQSATAMLVTALKARAYKTCLTSARLFVRHKKTARLPLITESRCNL